MRAGGWAVCNAALNFDGAHHAHGSLHHRFHISYGNSACWTANSGNAIVSIDAARAISRHRRAALSARSPAGLPDGVAYCHSSRGDTANIIPLLPYSLLLSAYAIFNFAPLLPAIFLL